MRVDEGRKGWSLLAITMETPTVAGKREKSLLSDPGSELRLGRKGGKKGNITGGMYAKKTLPVDNPNFFL